MLALFELANAEEYAANAVELEVILQKCQQGRTTGAIQVSSPLRGDLQFLLSRGELISIQLQTHFDDGITGPESWKTMLDSSDAASVRVTPLPPLALRLARLMAQSGQPVEKKIIEAIDLGSFLESWRSPLSLGLTFLGWANAEAIMVLPSAGKSIRDAVLLTRNGNIELGSDAWQRALSNEDEQCIVNIFSGQSDSQAWLDFQLHLAFVSLSELLIARYEQFAGRILVNAMARDIAVTAERGNWDIEVRGAIVEDWIFCRTPAEAASIYREVLNVVRHHLGVVLGNRRVMTIMAESMASIPPPYHGLIQSYNLLPEALASSGSGGH